jgi:hypothetical protein
MVRASIWLIIECDQLVVIAKSISFWGDKGRNDSYTLQNLWKNINTSCTRKSVKYTESVDGTVLGK